MDEQSERAGNGATVEQRKGKTETRPGIRVRELLVPSNTKQQRVVYIPDILIYSNQVEQEGASQLKGRFFISHILLTQTV